MRRRRSRLKALDEADPRARRAQVYAGELFQGLSCAFARPLCLGIKYIRLEPRSLLRALGRRKTPVLLDGLWRSNPGQRSAPRDPWIAASLRSSRWRKHPLQATATHPDVIRQSTVENKHRTSAHEWQEIVSRFYAERRAYRPPASRALSCFPLPLSTPPSPRRRRRFRSARRRASVPSPRPIWRRAG